MSTKVGTFGYVAPELIAPMTGKYTSSVDMWSLGCVIYWVLTGLIPFARSSVLDMFPIEPLETSQVSDAGVEFLGELLTVQPDRRLSAVDALQHEWLQEVRQWGEKLEAMAKKQELPKIKYVGPVLYDWKG